MGVLHLDCAAAGRQSPATLAAVAAHAEREAERGAYVAQAEAAPTLDRLRSDVASIMGVGGGGVAFVESATNALRALLDSWPVTGTVGLVAAEWGPNIELFERYGLKPVELATDPDGRLDVASLAAGALPDLVHLVQVTSHRGLVQPVRAAAEVCRARRVPLWVDAAQAIGHVDIATGADAIYATSRKWLRGPRGVGMLAVPERNGGRLDVLRLSRAGDLPPVQHLESHEAHVAGRVGLANAVREYLAAGPAAVHARLDEVGRQTREALAGLDGWAMLGGAGAITALRPLAGQDVDETRARLLAEHQILTTCGDPARAPRDMAEPLLRISPHIDVTTADLARLGSALAEM